jgi:hypothetical protein
MKHSYGGSAGGSKTNTLIGLGLTAHQRSLILRRTNKEASKLVDEIAEEEELTMLDTTPITTAITKLIAAGVTGDELVACVMREFPLLTVAKLSQAVLQVGPIDCPAVRKGSLARVRALLRLAIRHAG